MEKATLGFHIYKIWQILKHFAGTFCREQTLKLGGVKHALKKYDQFALNTSCFWGNTGSNITPVVQFQEFFARKIMNKLIHYYCFSKKIRKIAQLCSNFFFQQQKLGEIRI